MKVYIDLDGVLTNFDKKLEDLLGYKPPKEFKDPEIWAKISKAGEKFWANMEWMPDGHKLWDEVKKYDPSILSAPSNHPSSIKGKKEWLEKELPGAHYIIEKDKYKYADKESILIDDREKNIKKWEEAGGVGILHKNAEDTIKKLNELMVDMKNKEAGSRTLINPETGKRILLPRGKMPPPKKIIRPDKGGRYDRRRGREKQNWRNYIDASVHNVVLKYLKESNYKIFIG